MEYCLKNDISIDDLYIASTLNYRMSRRFKEGKFKCWVLNRTDYYTYCAYNYKGETYNFRISSFIFSKLFKLTVNGDWE